MWFTLGEPAPAGGLVYMISRDLFQPLPLCDSVIRWRVTWWVAFSLSAPPGKGSYMGQRKDMQHASQLILATEQCSKFDFMWNGRSASQKVIWVFRDQFLSPHPTWQGVESCFSPTHRVPVLDSTAHLTTDDASCLYHIHSMQINLWAIFAPSHLPGVPFFIFDAKDAVGSIRMFIWQLLLVACKNMGEEVLSTLKVKLCSVCYQIYLKPCWERVEGQCVSPKQQESTEGSLGGSMEHPVLQKHFITE